jgi:hypothetical protein
MEIVSSVMWLAAILLQNIMQKQAPPATSALTCELPRGAKSFVCAAA